MGWVISICIKRLTKEAYIMDFALKGCDLNYNFECDCLIELSDNKLSDNNLASELFFLNQSQS